MPKIITEIVRKFIIRKNGKINKNWKYINAHDKFYVECEKNHKWETNWNYLQQNSWCPYCSGRKIDKDVVTKFIKNKGGKLKGKYIDTKSKFLVECENHHAWKTTWLNIHSGKHWCPKCRDYKRGLQLRKDENQVKKYIKNKGGILNRNWKYTNSYKKFDIECNKCHNHWKTKWKILVGGSWCPHCAIQNRKKNELYVKKFIENKKGKLKDNWKYTKCETKFWIECEKSHHWKTTWNSIKKGHWCPICSRLIGAVKGNVATILYHWKTREKLICVGSYETKTVKYLNKNRINFLWQHKKFKMPHNKFYHPDVYLKSENKWVEIKGYFWGKSKEKWEWFHSKYPNSELWNQEKLKKMGII